MFHCEHIFAQPKLQTLNRLVKALDRWLHRAYASVKKATVVSHSGMPTREHGATLAQVCTVIACYICFTFSKEIFDIKYLEAMDVTLESRKSFNTYS